MTTITLTTPLSKLEHLQRLADGRRGHVQVDREALAALLIDHHAMVRFLQSHSYKVEEPREQRKRPAVQAEEE